jgi:hypothetical protein
MNETGKAIPDDHHGMNELIIMSWPTPQHHHDLIIME